MCVIAAVVMSYFEAGTVVSGTVVATMRVCKDEEPDGSKEEDKGVRLDFKSVYDKVENRFKRHQLESHKTSVPNCTSHLQSTTCNKSQLQNGSSANNGNIRNRKAKKTSHEISQMSNTGKQVSDKISTSRNSVQSMSILDFMDDGNTSSSGNSANSNITNLGKKDKENASVGSLQSSVGKKKKPITGNQQSSSVLQPSSQGSIKNKKGRVESMSTYAEKITKGKTEEETSSTTTEGSNSEDFTPPLDKERKQSLKSSSDSKTSNKCPKKEKQEKSKQTSGSTENVSDSTEQLVTKYSSDEFMNKKQLTGKKKEQTKQPYNSNNSPSRNVSPKQDMWDAPRPPSGDDFSELAAQTEAFVMQKPPKRNNSGGDPSNSYNNNSNIANIGPLGNSNPNLYAPQAIHQISPSFLQQHQGSQSVSSTRSNSKKPGVIGQPRPVQSQSTAQIQQQQQVTTGSNCFGQAPVNSFNSRNNFAPVSDISSIPSSLASVSSVSNLSKRQTSPTTTSNGRPCGNSTGTSIWGPDILPNNGCDIWGRRTTEPSSNPVPGYYLHHPSKPSPDPNYARGGGSSAFRGPNTNNFQQTQNIGYGTATSLSSGMHKLSGDNQFSDSRMPPRSTITGSMLSGNTYASGNNLNLPRNGSDSTYLYGGESYDILSSLWQMNNGGQPHPDQQFRGPGFSNGHPPQFGISQSNSSQSTTPQQQQHGYLQRMGSDPSNMLRTQQPSKIKILFQ